MAGIEPMPCRQVRLAGPSFRLSQLHLRGCQTWDQKEKDKFKPSIFVEPGSASSPKQWCILRMWKGYNGNICCCVGLPRQPSYWSMWSWPNSSNSSYLLQGSVLLYWNMFGTGAVSPHDQVFGWQHNSFVNMDMEQAITLKCSRIHTSTSAFELKKCKHRDQWTKAIDFLLIFQGKGSG